MRRVAAVLGWVATVAVAAGLILLVAEAPVGRSGRVAAGSQSRPTRIPLVSYGTDEGSDGDWDLWTVEADGSNLKRLTLSAAWVFDPVWSPDRTRLAFASAERPADRKSDIMVMNADGSDRRAMTRHPAGTIAGCPSWSPDGSRIVFQTAPLGPELHAIQLHVVDLNSGVQSRLGPGLAPDWSPDGQRILFAREPDDLAGIGVALFTMKPDRQGVTLLQIGRTAAPFGASWSPDGKSIAFIGDADGRPGLFVAAADGSGARLLWRAEAPKSDVGGLELPFGPQWSHDGKSILYTVSPDVFMGVVLPTVYAIPAEGGAPSRLVERRMTSGGYLPALNIQLSIYSRLGWPGDGDDGGDKPHKP
jgi:TolB protein